ncbi:MULTISPECIES: RHS repeat-associated core domain-containing protein [unclassified Pseudomonas]|uniref:RHS repeat-associated core domain-containing protein n=1 Tax=unclassified Pseudomonas TaxID=196821 RepID=UPI0015AF5450|nr:MULTISPECIES: RHS repeat-associated core domain-containing protein [unclassified Pseudomonas]
MNDDRIMRSLVPDSCVHYFYQGTHRVLQRTRNETVHVLRTSEAFLVLSSQGLGYQHSGALLVDDANSLLGAAQERQQAAMAYTPYGYRGRASAVAIGFVGQWIEPFTSGYLLGNGHRLYSPVLMRFSRPDALSPFAQGGCNAYAYCQGDPVNSQDPSGRVREWWRTTRKSFDALAFGGRGSRTNNTKATQTMAEPSYQKLPRVESGYFSPSPSSSSSEPRFFSEGNPAGSAIVPPIGANADGSTSPTSGGTRRSIQQQALIAAGGAVIGAVAVVAYDRYAGNAGVSAMPRISFGNGLVSWNMTPEQSMSIARELGPTGLWNQRAVVGNLALNTVKHAMGIARSA